jgi:hypothetical protein
MKPRTPFAETEALLAVLVGDRERLAELLAGMTFGELVYLEQVAEKLAEAASLERHRTGRADPLV